jgi:hypothetical protein
VWVVATSCVGLVADESDPVFSSDVDVLEHRTVTR